jgi:hypothetical protein
MSNSSNCSFVEHENISIPLEELISPMRKFTFNNESRLAPPKMLEFSDIKSPTSNPDHIFEDQLNSSEYEDLRKIIEEKYSSCIDIISNTIFPQDVNQDHEQNLEDYLTETSDLQEIQILNKLEHLITHQKSLEALKLVRWRKKICKIAIMDGWEIADQISKKTVSDLTISSKHLIEANLNKFLMKFDN